jgi:TetR/AcrR family transcriptional regulator, cholesterol catabolism regulator
MASKIAKTARRSRSVIPDEVLDRAAELFLANGYHQTRMQDIAEFFGVTHAALYYHFQNKQEILAQLNIRSIEVLLTGARAAVDAGLPPRETLMELLRRHMTHVALSPGLAATLLEHDLEIPKPVYTRISRLRREYNNIIVDQYEIGRSEGLFPDIDARISVSVLVGACNWVYRWYDPDGVLGPEELVNQAMQLLEIMLDKPMSEDKEPKP